MKRLLAGFAFVFGCQSAPKMVDIPIESESWFGQKEKIIKYSDQERMPASDQRDYVRMTRERLEKENDVGATAGSMWVMDGQGSYLFVQNKARKEGDLLNIKLEGAALKQVENKVAVIKKLLEQIELENKKFKNQERGLSQKAEEDKKRAVASDSAPAAEEKEKLDVEFVPTRITEKLPDGNYRVSGQQPFMLGQKQFKVLITGLVRPDDFSEDGTSSNQLIDTEVDVLSVRKKKSESL